MATGGKSKFNDLFGSIAGTTSGFNFIKKKYILLSVKNIIIY
jgi:hypothetical protein